MSTMQPARPRHYCGGCGRMEAAVQGAFCWSCAVAVTPLDDPIAVAYRARVAARQQPVGGT